MKSLTRLALFIAVLALPAYAHAQGIHADADSGMHCPMMMDMESMMKEMNSMMKSMTDPAIKKRMQKMHKNMQAMINRMQKMHEGTMCDSKMMQNDKVETEKSEPLNSEDHSKHH